MMAILLSTLTAAVAVVLTGESCLHCKAHGKDCDFVRARGGGMGGNHAVFFGQDSPKYL